MKLLTYQEAAALLSLPIGTMYALVHRKKIAHVRFGPRSVRFDEAKLRDWYRSRVVDGGCARPKSKRARGGASS